ncbi:DUF3037 domain-containing protein [Streptomyces pluripotens]|uniref:DUF3037 domain-containing protein n=1 Tax=Streptomyces pluripotens TaxID=1355015 RepID=A0A221NTY8_9ACTN|nr:MULTISPECIES: DUF3037 domain-containing protein [Streptomyces]ARP69113.1 hypothetical protein LK06_003190 [Streptomyces pluripotens]ASN23372.1 DUF3037 domain-containing protein [Streptomyces pluripotens]KIE25644.1 hypothetical protein LK08_18185 [Streptomyces sp. MUSC 125]MCH0559032.1 DUF3037 domain-containing protein [Streptomyces sp. MUM 16J]
MSERHVHVAGHVTERHITRAGQGGDRDVFEYALLRVVPRVERGECINAGVIVYSRAQAYVGARIYLDEARLLALDPRADVAGIQAALEAVKKVCTGGDAAGQAARDDAGRRFRWLIAPRSTVVQPGPVHTGLTADPAAEAERLLDLLVR